MKIIPLKVNRKANTFFQDWEKYRALQTSNEYVNLLKDIDLMITQHNELTHPKHKPPKN